MIYNRDSTWMFCYAAFLKGIAACPLVNLCKLVLVEKQKEKPNKWKSTKAKRKTNKKKV